MNAEINKWIEEVRKAGLNNQQISEQLKSRGYTDEQITKLLNQINENLQVKKPSILEKNFPALFSISKKGFIKFIFIIIRSISSIVTFFIFMVIEYLSIAFLLCGSFLIVFLPSNGRVKWLINCQEFTNPELLLQVIIPLSSIFFVYLIFWKKRKKGKQKRIYLILAALYFAIFFWWITNQ